MRATLSSGTGSSSDAPAAAGPVDRRRRVIFAGLLALAVLWVFAPVRGHDFVDYDDTSYVVDNAHLREPLDLGWVAHNFTELHHAYWIPLTWLSYRIDVALFGVDAPAMLTVNVLLHLVSALLLGWVLGRTTGHWTVAAFVALVFAVHPQRVESVAWVTERKDVLGGLFWMLAMAAYLRLPRNARGDVVVGALLALGLMAKPMLVTFPVSLLLLDLWPLRRLGHGEGRRPWTDLLVEKLPFFGLAGAAALIVMQSQRLMGGMDFAQDFGLGTRLGIALVSVAQYLGDFVWPSGLSPFYPHPMEDPAPVAIMGSALLLTVITAVCLRQWSRRPWLAVGWAWFLVNLLPVSGIVGVGMQARADRWMYVPSIGLAIMIGFTVAELAATRGHVLPARLRRLAPGALLAVVAVALILPARAQVHVWRDTESLFTRAVELDADNWYAHHRLAVLRRGQERYEEAAAHYLVTVTRLPGFAYAQGELGDVYIAQGRREAAAVLHANVDRTGWDDPFADGRLGLALTRVGETEAARPLLEAALARDPESGDLHAALAVAHAAALDVTTARHHLDRALRVAPRTVDGLALLAWLLATAPEGELRDADMALRTLDELARLHPEAATTRPDVLDARAAAEAARGDYGAAFGTARRAVDAALALEHHERARAAEDRSLLYLQGEPYYQERPVRRSGR